MARKKAVRVLSEDDRGRSEGARRCKEKRNVGWDELVIEAVSAHYQLDRAVMALPRKEKPAKEAEQRPAERISEGRDRRSEAAGREAHQEGAQEQ